MESPFSAPQPHTPRKRAKIDNTTSSTPRRSPRKPGKLAPVLTKLPVELALTILSQLSPVDLLSVLRSEVPCLVEALESAHRTSIWSTSFESIPDLPKCPESMEPWEYAALLFTNKCTTCDNTVKTVDWDYLRRICTKCRKETKLSEQISSEDRKAILPLKEWLEEYVKEKAKEREMARKDRKDAITQWIASEMQNELAALTHNDKEKKLYRLNIVNQPRRISSEEWPKIQNRVREFFVQVKLAKQYENAVSTLKDIYFNCVYRTVHPEYLPDFADFCFFFPEVANAIRATAEGNHLWDQEAISYIQSWIIPETVPAWQHHTFQILFNKIPNTMITPGLDPDAVIHLATTWFQARDGLKDREKYTDAVQMYPGILRERFVRKRLLDYDHLRGPEDYIHNALARTHHPVPWLAAEQDIVFSQRAADMAREVVLASGLDPLTASQNDMDCLNLRYACACDKQLHLRTWRQIVLHRTICNSTSNDGTLIVLDEDESGGVVILEQEKRSICASAQQRYPCKFCHHIRRDWTIAFGNFDELRDHILDIHIMAPDDMAPDERGILRAHTYALETWDVSGMAVRCISKNRANARFALSSVRTAAGACYAIID